MAKRRRKLLAFLQIGAFSLALFEGLCSAFAWWKYGTLDVKELNARDTGNVVVTDAGDFAATLAADPLVGMRYNHLHPNANNVGLFGPDFPLRKDESKFTILLTGGSVAAALQMNDRLGKVLNENYNFGKPVVVLDGAGSGWNQPKQLVMLELYGDVVDAVVSLEGMNESLKLGGTEYRLEEDWGPFKQINPAASGGFDRLGAAWQANRLRQFAERSHSRAVYFLTRAMRNAIERSAAEVKYESAYRLPKEWTSAERIQFNLEQYQKYLRLMRSTADALGLKQAYFLQPCPAIGKKLTEEELRVVGQLDYADRYRKMAEAVPLTSLTDMFDDTSETVYVDWIHNNEYGQQIMAERIARELSQTWNVSKREETARK